MAPSVRHFFYSFQASYQLKNLQLLLLFNSQLLKPVTMYCVQAKNTVKPNVI